MNLRRVIFLVVALVIAVGTAVVARNWVAAERAAAIASVPKTVVRPSTLVLVAAKELTPGAFVKPDSLKWQPWPEDGVLESYVVKGKSKGGKPVDFSGAVVRTRLLAGQPITDQGIVHPGERGFMAAVLTPGRRAVSVPVNATSGISGFVFPGDQVDVILTLLLPGSEKLKRRASQTLITAVRVLAVDQVVDNADGKAAVAKTATLEVSPKQAEQVALALQMGSLSLSLRSLALTEEEQREKDAVSPASLLKFAAGPEKKADSYTMDREILFMRRKAASSGGSSKVNVLRGGKAETAKF